MTMPEDVYFGPATPQEFCVFDYRQPGWRCANHIDFVVKVPDGRTDDWRKGWNACAEHLPDIILQMHEAYGGAVEFQLLTRKESNP